MSSCFMIHFTDYSSLLFNLIQHASQEGTKVFFARTDKRTQSQIFLVQFQASECRGLFDIVDHQRSQELGGENVQGHDPFKNSHRNHRPAGTVGVRVESKAAADEQGGGKNSLDGKTYPIPVVATPKTREETPRGAG